MARGDGWTCLVLLLLCVPPLWIMLPLVVFAKVLKDSDQHDRLLVAAEARGRRRAACADGHDGDDTDDSDDSAADGRRGAGARPHVCVYV